MGLNLLWVFTMDLIQDYQLVKLGLESVTEMPGILILFSKQAAE